MYTLSTLLLFAVLTLFVSSSLGYIRRYDGYKVLRVNTTDESHLENLLILTEKLNLDIWAENKIEAWIDVMVSSYQFSSMQQFDFTVISDDVQSLIDANEEERRASAAVVGDFFTDFPTTGHVTTWLNEQISLHVGVASRVVLGQTYEGSDILGLQLNQDTSKKVFFLHCTIHAREWIATTSCLWIIDRLLNDPAEYSLLIKFRWIIVPIFNVDGYDYTHTIDRLWRKNRVPNAGGCVGTDVNRNYGYAWGGSGASTSPCSETYRGSNAWSSPEASAERGFLKPYIDSSTIASYIDIHSYGGYFMSSWGYTTTYPPAADYNLMSQQMTRSANAIRSINGRSYTVGPSGRVLYLTSGGTTDFFYGDGGIVQSYTIECAGSNFTPAPSQIPIIGAEVWAGVRAVATAL